MQILSLHTAQAREGTELTRCPRPGGLGAEAGPEIPVSIGKTQPLPAVSLDVVGCGGREETQVHQAGGWGPRDSGGGEAQTRGGRSRAGNRVWSFSARTRGGVTVGWTGVVARWRPSPEDSGLECWGRASWMRGHGAGRWGLSPCSAASSCAQAPGISLSFLSFCSSVSCMVPWTWPVCLTFPRQYI